MASPPVVEAGAVDAVRRVLGLRDRPVFLYPAISYPHKNHRVLLEAQAVLRRSHPEAVLVLTGAAGAEDSTIRERSSRSDLAGSVVIAGRVARPSLEALYATAVATVFPSLYEGFGLPVLEAMARGCPVIAADATALPEVVGRGGMLLDPRSPDHWARAMRRLVEEPSERRRWIAAGAEQAAGFAWERSAAGTIALWKEVVS
jgi:alpha-1,3-rhamnosyl/mannosyltransferase